MLKFYVLFLIFFFDRLKADYQNNNNVQYSLQYSGEGYISPQPDDKCIDILKDFAKYASNLTECTIINARPTLSLCEKCVLIYVKFRDKYQELLDTVVNETSCRSIFISHDRLNAVQQYHDNILNVWNMGNCNDCFVWTQGNPSLKNDTKRFHQMYNDTMKCIKTNMVPNSSEVCNTCLQSYEQLDEFYKTLSADSIGIDSVCMDIVDAMNATRSIWSKTLNCCNLRRTPELVFLSCAGIISFLPVLYYIAVRYCGPIRDLPNVLKQSRFKQTILRGLSIDSRSD